MTNHKQAAEGLIELLDINEDNSVDPQTLAMMAHTHAMIALIEAIERLGATNAQRPA